MYESSNREPDFITVEMFADVFNVNISTLLGEKEKAPALSSKDFIKEILDNSSNAELIDIIQMATERLKGN